MEIVGYEVVEARSHEALASLVVHEIKMPITSIPMMLYSGYKIYKDKKSFSKLTDAIKKFLDEYNENEEYKQFIQSGTSSSENVKGRLSYWKKIIKDL